ncbi:MAG: hypothetical protein QOF60_2693 [Actinomycetota bacterium]|jgi:hypothetical protein|nr:hypothetical protein [Actinomycetota bacterium]MEA3077785.1 hypothetical protein [Actinomycetota bacterium]
MLVPVYIVYLVVSVGLVAWLARTLYRNGALFLEGVFADPRMAEAVNRLLVTGFYMLNLGYAALLLKSDAAPTAVDAFEVLSQKLGVLLVSLAGVHFVNMWVFHLVRRRAAAPAPLGPTAPPATASGPAGVWVPAQ